MASTGERLTADGNGKMRALVVADEAVSGEELREALLEELGERIGAVFVVAPAMPDSGLKYTLGDIDDAVGPAEERLRKTLEELRSAGIEADGEVGDSDPMQAIQDEVVKFDPGQIVLVAHPDGEGLFAEKGLLEQAERDLELPVTELVVDKRDEPHVLDVRHTEAGSERARGWRPSGNLPPFTNRDVLGIFVAVIGTLVLGFLATKVVGDATGTDLEENRLSFAGAAAILIATAMSLLNLAHIVGLFLFQSVGYDGLWSRFFARISLFGTPIAVALVLILVFVN